MHFQQSRGDLRSISAKTSAESYPDVAGMEAEREGLLGQATTFVRRQRWSISATHIATLYATIAFLGFMVGLLILDVRRLATRDPSLAIYSPANAAVEYIDKHHFRAALFNRTEYMGFPSDETDRLWSELYNFGISKISAHEAQQLSTPTLPIPGTQEYLVELDVWHELHCLNDLRMVLYPERYGGLEALKFANGTINRETDAFRHWDHCIDSIRQALMCHADVAPIPFHINVPASQGIFPRLATTHTCRNFTKIQDWAREHSAGVWRFKVDPQEAEDIIQASSFDHSPEEDIQFLWPLFPGNQYFDHWKGPSA